MMNSLKNTLSLEVKSNIFNFSCNLHRRITIIHTSTYPCNLCANKITQVGIKKVVYFELCI